MSRLSILKNTLALAVPNVLNPLVSFLLVMVISRYLGVDGLGEYSLILSYFGIFATFASLGLADLLVREAARRPQDAHRLFVNAIPFGTISSLGAMVGMNAVVLSLNYGTDIVVASFICSFALVASTGINYVEAMFRAREQAEYVALAYVAENAIRVGVCVLLLWKGYGIVGLFYGFTGTRLLGVLLMSLFYLKFLGRPAWRQDRQVWRLLSSQAATFASIAIFSTVHLSIDQIMLSKLDSIAAVGIYSSADRLLTICKTLPAAFASALLPFLTKAYAEGPQELRTLVARSAGHMMLVLSPLVVGTAILADRFISVIYGPEFAAAGSVLRLHIVSVIPFSLVYLFAQTLIATDNQAVDLKINIVAAVMNVVLNLIFIPPLGVIGSVLATLITIVAFYYLQNVYVKSYLFSISVARISLRPFLAALGMGAVTYGLRDWNLFLNVGISAATWAGLVLACGAVSRQDIQALGRIWSQSHSR